MRSISRAVCAMAAFALILGTSACADQERGSISSESAAAIDGLGNPDDVPVEVLSATAYVHSLLKYGVGTPGAITVDDMNGEGNCGHFALLVTQELSDYHPVVYSLYGDPNAHPSPIHAVVEIATPTKRMVVDATLGVVYPYSIAELLADSSRADYFVGSIDFAMRYYGPYIYKNIGTIDYSMPHGAGLETSGYATRTISSGSIVEWENDGDTAGVISTEVEAELDWNDPIRLYLFRVVFSSSVPDGTEFPFELTYKDLSDVNHTVTGTLHVFNGVAQYVPAELISMKSATIKVTGSVSPFSVEDLLIRGDLVPSGFAFDVSNISYHGLYW